MSTQVESCDQMVPAGSDDEPSPGFPVPLGADQTEPTSETENPSRDSNANDRPNKTTVVSIGEEEEEECLQKDVSKLSEEGKETTRASSSSAVLEEVSGLGLGVVNNVSDEMLLCVDEQLDSDSSQDSE